MKATFYVFQRFLVKETTQLEERSIWGIKKISNIVRYVPKCETKEYKTIDIGFTPSVGQELQFYDLGYCTISRVIVSFQENADTEFKVYVRPKDKWVFSEEEFNEKKEKFYSG